MTNLLNDLQSELTTNREALQARIGAHWMQPLRARIGRPTDGLVFVEGGNLPYKSEVYIQFVTDEDPQAYTTALRGQVALADILLDRTVIVKKAPNGMYELAGFDSFEDAIYSENIEQAQAPTPVKNHQLVEQGTLHPVPAALQVRVAPGRFGTYNYSGGDSANFGSGTVQDTSAANITIPTTNGQAKAVLVQLDTVNGDLEFKQSSEFDALLTLQQADNAALLPSADTGKYLLGYFKLVKGMTTTTTLTYDQIWNVMPRVTGGSEGAPVDATYIVQTANGTLTNEQALGALATGILKNTTTTGVLSIATAGTDYLTPDAAVNTLTLNDASELTIAGGAITVTHARHTVDTEADASSDFLDTVNGLGANEICVISSADNARVPIVRTAGNITTAGGSSISLTSTAKAVLLLGNTAGTGVTAFDLNLSKAVDLNDVYSLGATGYDTIVHTGTIFTVQNNRVTTIDPTTGDDENDGYTIASWWINISTPAVFFCTDNTVGAAVWVDVTAHADRHERAGSDEIDGDHLDIDFTPTNYTPDATPAEADNVDDLAAHLYGIDVALGSAGSAYVADGITFTDPTAQTWNNLNHGAGTYTEDTTNKRLTILEDGDGSIDVRGWYCTAPAAPYVATFYVQQQAQLVTNNAACVFHRQNSTSELRTVTWRHDGTNLSVAVTNWNSATSLNANVVANVRFITEPRWFQIEDDNTDVFYRISPDGIAWHTLYTIARTTFLTPDELGFGALLQTASTYDTTASLLSLELT